MWSAGPVEMEGGTLSDRLGDVQNILHLRHRVRSFRHLVSQRTYTPLKQEYAALVTWPSECHVTAQDSYLHLLLDLGQLPEDRKDLPFGA